jgi:hypothetical protein
MGKVTVYKIRLYDTPDDAPVFSTRMATCKGAHMMGGVIVEGSGVEIDGSQLVSSAQWTPSDFSPNRRAVTQEERIPGGPGPSPSARRRG